VIDDLIGRLRKDYEAKGLIEEEMADDPLEVFDEWFKGVVDAGLEEPHAFVLATSGSDGRPSARVLLMKDLDEDGLVFVSNLDSPKGSHLRENPHAAATFAWIPLHRQVRFEGQVTQIESELADFYFDARPRGAQIAAHASAQSRPVPNRSVMDERFAELEAEFGEADIPRPDTWGGWRLYPETIEFWQGQPNRFHDRVKYSRLGSSWSKERLAP
jgi:pyridoxamine 5'-phosphate oxidase